MSGTDSYGEEGDSEVIKEAIAFIKERNGERKKLRNNLMDGGGLNAKGKILQIIYFALFIPVSCVWGLARLADFIADILDDIASWIVYLIFYCFMRDKEGENTNDDSTESN